VLFATDGPAATVAASPRICRRTAASRRPRSGGSARDMSPAFIKGVTEHLGVPDDHQPQVVFDRYHVAAKADEAVDTVRRAEAKTRPELKRSRYAFTFEARSLSAVTGIPPTPVTPPRDHGRRGQ
jgi:hypothetical protein